jgi:cyclic pyranopterin phosphate synthase
MLCTRRRGALSFTRAFATTAAADALAQPAPAPAADRDPLFDSFQRRHNYLRISLTERCNLRCMYCMPEQGIELTPDPGLLTTDEFVRIARLFAAMGVDKIRLTGGEPLVRKDIVDICQRLANIPGIQKLAITTNGILLPRYIERLKAAGVTGLNISLDTLQADRFLMITRRNGYDKVIDSIRLAESLGYDPVKINCVMMRGVNDDELGAFADLTKNRQLEVRFIEYMPFDDNKWSRNKMFSFMEMMDRIEAHCGAKLIHVAKGETAQLFRVPGHVGTVGFIASMTTAFCSTCNRLRMTADGNLKTCLFGEQEWSLRDAIRAGANDDELAVLIRRALFGKHATHGGKASAEEIAASVNRPMIKIGG